MSNRTRMAINLLSLSLSLVLTNGLAAQTSPPTVTARPIGRIFLWPQSMAPAAGMHQQVMLVQLQDGSIAALVYRFRSAADRLPHASFNVDKPVSLTAQPLAGCPATLRGLVFLRTIDAKTGTALTRLTLARLPGVQPQVVSGHLDRPLACYLAGPGDFAKGGAQ